MTGKRKRMRARDYRRVSADRRGKLESPEQQRDTNRAHAEREGWDYLDGYAETEAVSASRYSTRARDAFARLVDDIEGGRFGADILMLWEASRGSRKMHEWVRLIDGCERAGILIYVTSHGRTYDPRNGRDRRSLLEDGTDSEYESWKVSQRIRRDVAAKAAEGRPHGRAPYGYRPVHDTRTGALLTWEPEPGEAEVIRELFARLYAGESLRSIARSFEEKGITTRGSKRYKPRPFSDQHLRVMALTPAYTALRVHQPGSGESAKNGGAGRNRATLAGATEGTWPPLVDREVFYAVHRRLTDPGRRSGGERGRPRHLLSLIARCGECGSNLTAAYPKTPDGRQRVYACRDRHCIRVDADDLDAYAAAHITLYLDDPRNAKQLVPDSGPELDAARQEHAAAVAELDDWREKARRREVTAASFAVIEPGLLAGIEEKAERVRALEVPPELAGFIDGYDTYGEAWDAAEIPARRAVARLMCSPRYLGYLAVTRTGRERAAVAERARWDRGD